MEIRIWQCKVTVKEGGKVTVKEGLNEKSAYLCNRMYDFGRFIRYDSYRMKHTCSKLDQPFDKNGLFYRVDSALTVV